MSVSSVIVNWDELGGDPDALSTISPGAAIARWNRPFASVIWLGVWSEKHRALRFYARFGFARAGEYDFHVGDTVDHEYILRRDAVVSSSLTANSTSIEHNPA